MVAAILTGIVGLITLIHRVLRGRRGQRAEALKELQTKFDNLPVTVRSSVPESDKTAPDDSPDFEPLISFLTEVASCREEGEVRLSEIDRWFGEWFFRAMHGPLGAKIVCDNRFDKLKKLYSEWYQYRVRHKKPLADADTFAAQRWALHTRTHANNGRINWHHTLHKEAGEATLVFWRLRFEPRYNPREILDFIETVCEDFGIGSCVVYELLGPHDLLLRCWLPHADSTTPVTPSVRSRSTASRHDSNGDAKAWIDQMTDDLKAQPGGATERCDYFRVEDIRRHWWWHDERWWSRRDSSRDLGEEAAANYLACDKKDEVSHLVSQYNAGKIRRRDVWLNKAARSYRKKHYIRHRPLRHGIKFATIIRAKDEAAVDKEARNYIKNLVEDASSISDRSLYEGKGFEESGVPAQFLILGRVKPRRFEKIRKQIIDPVVKTEVIAKHFTPTLTYVATGPEVMLTTYKDRVKRV